MYQRWCERQRLRTLLALLRCRHQHGLVTVVREAHLEPGTLRLRVVVDVAGEAEQQAWRAALRRVLEVRIEQEHVLAPGLQRAVEHEAGQLHDILRLAGHPEHLEGRRLRGLHGNDHLEIGGLLDEHRADRPIGGERAVDPQRDDERAGREHGRANSQVAAVPQPAGPRQDVAGVAGGLKRARQGRLPGSCPKGRLWIHLAPVSDRRLQLSPHGARLANASALGIPPHLAGSGRNAG